MTIALALGLIGSSCSKNEDTQTPVVVQQGVAEFSLEFGIEETEEQQRSFQLSSSSGLSQMAEGTIVPVHLFFSKGTQVSYVKKDFKVTAHKTLHLDWTTATLNGFTNKEDLSDWYVCGYIGGTPEKTTIDNKKLNFSQSSLTKVDDGGTYSFAYPYAFAWTKFKWSQTAQKTGNPLMEVKFKPQGTLIRLRLSYKPTAAPYNYKVTGIGLTSTDLTTNASVQIGTATDKTHPAWVEATTTLSGNNSITPLTFKPEESKKDSYWLWAVQTKANTDVNFKIQIQGEPIYPTSGNIVKSLLKDTETKTITIKADKLHGVSPAYNVEFNPERPLLPIEFMANGDANGDKSEADDGFVRGSTYLPITNVYGSTNLGKLMKSNRYLPTTLDMTSVVWSSVPDNLDPTLSAQSVWYTWFNASYNYDNESGNTGRFESIRMLQDYSGTDATVSKLKYSNDELKALYASPVKGYIVYGLRLIGDGNKRLSAWRYESVQNSGIKVEAVYLGPKWEHVGDIAQKKALRHVINESFWTTKRASGEVITRYLNQSVAPNIFTRWISIADPEALTAAELGRYIVSTTADNRGVGYNYIEFDRKKVWKVNQRTGLTEKSHPRYLQGYVRFFKENPYND